MEELEQLSKKVEDIGSQVKDIHRVIAGNDQYGQKGLKHIVEDYDLRIKTLEKHKDGEKKRNMKSAAIGGVIGTTAGIAMPKAMLLKFWSFLINLI